MAEPSDEEKYPTANKRGNRKAFSSDTLPANRVASMETPIDLPDCGGVQLANNKHEMYCRFVSQGESLVDAYELAGFRRSTANASTLGKRVDIRERIAYLEAFERNRRLEHEIRCREAGVDPDEMEDQMKREFIFTTNSVCQMFRENAKLAQLAGQFKAAHESITSIAKILKIQEDVPDHGKPTGDKNALTFIQEAAFNLGGENSLGPSRPNNALRPRVSSTGDDQRE